MADATELAAHFHRGPTRRWRRSSSRWSGHCSGALFLPFRAAHGLAATAARDIALGPPQDTPAPTASPYWLEVLSDGDLSP